MIAGALPGTGLFNTPRLFLSFVATPHEITLTVVIFNVTNATHAPPHPGLHGLSV